MLQDIQDRLNVCIMKVDVEKVLKLNTNVQVEIENSYKYGPNPVAIGLHALEKYRYFIYDLYEAVAAEAEIANARLQECVAALEHRMNQFDTEAEPLLACLHRINECKEKYAL